jgi:hypothetical protein
MNRRAFALLLPVFALACSETPVSPSTNGLASPTQSVSAAVTTVSLSGTSSYSSGFNHVVFATSGMATWDDIRITHGTTVITENFNSGAWNPSNFELANASNPGAVESGAYRSTGTIDVDGSRNVRGGLRTVQQLVPSALIPLRIWATYNSGASPVVSFFGWRNTGLPGGGFASFNEPGNGILLRLHNFNNGQTNLTQVTGAQVNANPGDAFYLSGPVRLSVVDNGTNVSVTIGPLLPLSSTGFRAPVSMTKINMAKGGSTVPLKFQVVRGDEPIADLSAVSSVAAQSVSCTASAAPASAMSTPATALRYDAEDEQFILNWRVPTTVGCYRTTITLSGGATFSARFEVRR